MEDQGVSFATAKLAKEKGLPSIMGVGYYSTGEGINRYRGHAPVYAPTQSLLQRWLREEHKLHIDLEAGIQDGLHWHTRVVELDVPNLPSPHDGGFQTARATYLGEFTTYEQALEEGLRAALKLV